MIVTVYIVAGYAALVGACGWPGVVLGVLHLSVHAASTMLRPRRK